MYGKELQSVQNLIVQQRSLVAAPAFEKLASIQADTFAERAKRLIGISADQVAQLTTLVEGGPWNDTQRTNLVIALASALGGGERCDAGKKEKRQSQDLLHFQNYSTEADNLVYTDTSACLVAKFQVAVARLDKLEAVLISEESKRRIVSVVCCTMGSQQWTDSDLRSWYLHFKKVYTAKFKSRHAAQSIGHILAYPESPNQIGDEKRKLMYGDEVPVRMPISDTHFTALHNMIWCRGNATALKAPAIATPQSAAGSSTDNPLLQLMSVLTSAAQLLGGGNSEVELPGHRRPLLSLQDVPRTSSAGMQRASSKASVDTDSQQSKCGGLAIEDAKAPPTHQPSEPVQLLPPTTQHEQLTLTPAEQAKKFLTDLKGGAAGDDDDDDDDDCVTPMKAAKKRPAAHTAKTTPSKTKKPSSAKAMKTMAKPTAAGAHGIGAPVKGWSEAKRRKLYPDGCSKCRNKPGCTSSCFRTRGQIK